VRRRAHHALRGINERANRLVDGPAVIRRLRTGRRDFLAAGLVEAALMLKRRRLFFRDWWEQFQQR